MPIQNFVCFPYKSVATLATFQQFKVSKSHKTGPPLETPHIPNQIY